MKISQKIILPALALALATSMTSLVTAKPTYTISDVRAPVNTANVSLSVEDGVATLHGTVGGLVEKVLLEQATENLEGIDHVRNYLWVVTY